MIGFTPNTLALPHTGDFSPGAGVSTATATNDTVLRAESIGAGSGADSVVGSQLLGTPAGHPVPWWIALGVLLVAIKFFAEKEGEGADFKNVRVGFFNIAIITLCAIVGITLMKWVFGVYKVPGLSAIVEAA